MAAIDFPAGTDGLLFMAPNGVAYQYKATPGAWFVAASPSTGPGDFHAQSDAAWTPVVGVAPFPNVKTGNAGNWFTPSGTYRYIPPAGRYFIYAAVSQFATGAGTGTLQIRKNGTLILRSGETASAGMMGSMTVNGVVDASGTDYFDVYVEALGGTGYSGAANVNCFGAFPVASVIINSPKITVAATAPTGPATNDLWVDTT